MTIVTVTNYYSLVLIPMGVLVLLFMKFGSDLSFSNRRLLIYSNDNIGIGLYVTESNLIDEISKTCAKNDKTFILEKMSPNINELEIMKVTRTKSEFLGPILELYDLGINYNGLLSLNGHEEFNRNNLIGRVAYEKFIENGNFKINKNNSIDEFLRLNQIGTSSILIPPFTGKYKIIDIYPKILDRIQYLPFVNNALILLLSSTGFIEVMG